MKTPDQHIDLSKHTIPPEIARYADEIALWANKEGFKRWELMGIADRRLVHDLRVEIEHRIKQIESTYPVQMKLNQEIDLLRAELEAANQHAKISTGSANNACAEVEILRAELDAAKELLTEIRAKHHALAADYAKAIAGETEMQELERLRAELTELTALAALDQQPAERDAKNITAEDASVPIPTGAGEWRDLLPSETICYKAGDYYDHRLAVSRTRRPLPQRWGCPDTTSSTNAGPPAETVPMETKDIQAGWSVQSKVQPEHKSVILGTTNDGIWIFKTDGGGWLHRSFDWLNSVCEINRNDGRGFVPASKQKGQ